MKRRTFLKHIGVGLVAASMTSTSRMAQAAGDASSKPNIVVILADDLGYGDLQCLNPDSKIPTPNMDRLAKEGMTFTGAHSGSAVCTPTRYGLITGRYCWRTRLKRGVLNGYSSHLIDPKRETVASLLKKSGYATGCVGKWHLGMDFARGSEGGKKSLDYTKPLQNTPTANGFDYFYGITASLDFPPYVYIENNRVTEQPTEQFKGGKFPAYLRSGPKAPGFKHIESLDHLKDKAIDYINQHANKAKPFFLYFPITSPHKPCLPAKRFQGKTKLGPYGDFIVQTDWTIGEVLKALDKNKIADNTLVILTSDNGSYMYRYDDSKPGHTSDAKVQGFCESKHRANYVFRGTKADIYEGGHHVPYLVRWPAKVKPASQCAKTICLTDIMATCVAAAGAKLPDNAAEDSFNTLPLLLGKDWDSPRAPVIHHSASGHFAIRDGKWKLVCSTGSGGRAKPKGKCWGKPYQLFDMTSDISEKKDVAKQHPDVVKRLEQAVKKIIDAGRSR